MGQRRWISGRLWMMVMLSNWDSNLLFRDQRFVVTEKMTGAHSHNFRLVADYFVRIYVAENSTEEVMQVSGLHYWSYEVGRTYIRRVVASESLFRNFILAMAVVFIASAWGLACWLTGTTDW